MIESVIPMEAGKCYKLVTKKGWVDVNIYVRAVKINHYELSADTLQGDTIEQSGKEIKIYGGRILADFDAGVWDCNEINHEEFNKIWVRETI